MQILRVHQESFHQDQIPKEFHFTLKIPDDIPKQVDYIYIYASIKIFETHIIL